MQTDANDSAPEAIPRNAATLVLWRNAPDGPEVLTGVRGSKARFMPGRRVFPGGALDEADREMPTSHQLAGTCLARLQMETERPELATALALTAIRETFEETGLALGRPRAPGSADSSAPGGSWERFRSLGLEPAVDALRFVFRAITPRRYPLRFDARFFLALASSVDGDPDDLSGASGELSALRWTPVASAMRSRELPFITGIVLQELSERQRTGLQVDRPVPFFTEGRHTEIVRRL